MNLFFQPLVLEILENSSSDNKSKRFILNENQLILDVSQILKLLNYLSPDGQKSKKEDFWLHKKH